MRIEVRCSGQLAIRLGAIPPATVAEHKQLRDAGFILIRDRDTAYPMFWPWAVNVADEIATRSSQ